MLGQPSEARKHTYSQIFSVKKDGLLRPAKKSRVATVTSTKEDIAKQIAFHQR